MRSKAELVSQHTQKKQSTTQKTPVSPPGQKDHQRKAVVRPKAPVRSSFVLLHSHQLCSPLGLEHVFQTFEVCIGDLGLHRAVLGPTH